MVRHGDWKMSTEGVQNSADNGGAHHNPHENGELLRNAGIASRDVGGESFLHDSVVGGRSPSIQDGGAGTDMVRQSSFEDFIGFEGGRLENPDCDIADVAGFSPSIVDGSGEWLKSTGSDVDGKMGFGGDANVVGLELSGEKSVHRELGDLFTPDNPLAADIPFSLSDGLSLPCSMSSFAKLSAGLCHSSPVSPTNFLEETMPASRSRSYSDTENDDRSQTTAFLEELERGSMLTAEDKEVMETSRKELQAYEFQVLAQDKSNSLLTPQELETLRVHGLEFEEAVDSTEALPTKSEVAKEGVRELLGAEACAPSSQSDLLGIVKTSLSFLSDSGKESDSQSKPLAESLLNESSQKVDDKPGEAISKHSNSATSGLAPAGELGPSPSGNWIKDSKTRQHSKKQPIKQQASLAKKTTQPAVLTKQQASVPNVEQLTSALVDDKKQLLQLDIGDGKLPLCVPNSTVSVPQQWSAGAIGDSTTNVAATLPISGGKNVYLTAVPMLYYKDGCLMIPIQQILTTEPPTDTTAISNVETTAAAAAVSVDTAAAAAAKPVDSSWEASASVIASTDNNQLQKSPSAPVAGQQTNNTKPLSNINLTKPTQASAKVDSKGAKKWVCNVCSQAFPRHYKLKIHFMKHTGEKPYKCSQPGCKWAFTTACKLKRHEESHLGKKDYVCDVEGCGKKFSTVYNLNTHKKSHSRLCTVECPTCNEKFSTQRQLDYHMRAQGHGKKELTYTCPHEGCGRKFFSRYCMGSHVRVHSHLEKIPCPVEGCKRVFDKQCRLQQHIRSHTGEKPFLCTGHGCGAAFATASKLKRHARKHTGERRWVCDVEGCGKAFLRAEHLRAHRITHTGEKPFQCNVTGCAARFKCKSSLYVHLKRHTQNANRDRQDSNVVSKGQRANKQSHKASQNQKNSYNRQIQNALGDLFTLINANDLESLINSQVETTQQVPDSVRTGTNTVETLLHAVHTQSVNPSDVLSVNQDGLPTILNINPVATSVQQTVGQLIQQGTSLSGDVLQQGCVLPSGVGLFKDQLRSVINVAPVKLEKHAVGHSGSDNYSVGKKIQRVQTAESSPQTLGFSGPVKVEINHTEFPDSTTLSIQEDQVSTTANNLVNPNDVMTSQAITFRDPETGAIYVQTQLLQDDPPNPDVYGDGNIVCLDNNDQAGLADFPNIFNDSGHDDLVDPPGVLEFTGTTINLQDLE